MLAELIPCTLTMINQMVSEDEKLTWNWTRVPGELNCFKGQKDQQAQTEQELRCYTERGTGQKVSLAISDHNTSSRWVWRGGATCAWEVGFGAGNRHVGVGSRRAAGLGSGISSPHWIARPSHGNHTGSWNTQTHRSTFTIKSLSISYLNSAAGNLDTSRLTNQL